MLELIAYQETSGVKRLKSPTYTVRDSEGGNEYGYTPSLCKLKNALKQKGFDPNTVSCATREGIEEVFPHDKNVRPLNKKRTRQVEEYPERRWRERGNRMSSTSKELRSSTIRIIMVSLPGVEPESKS